MTKITIIGSGFGGLSAVREVRKRDKKCEITLISPRADFIYSPSLIWIPTGLRTGKQITVPLQKFFKRMKVEHVAAEVSGLKDCGRMVETSAGEIANDGLIIASGSRFLKKLPGFEHALTLCEGVKAAEQIKARLEAMDGGSIAFGFSGNPNDPLAVRGGPMFELMFGVETMLRRHKKRQNFDLKFFSPAPKPGIRLGEKAYNGLLKKIGQKGIEVASLGVKLERFEADKVVTQEGEFTADLILFMPGMTGPGWLDNSELPRSKGGMIEADETTRVKGFEKVYVVGDSGNYANAPDWGPKQAHMADLQAAAAAANLLGELKGKASKETFKWELICIVDTLDTGIMVFRNEKRKTLLPATKLMHWSKRAFEWNYMRQYR
ncbi:MAG: FAD-dependent oxidoreductase [Hyphomicrobiaceae bacterium]|nr:FAD-dependent oxidoreductase [Hyphomicrobiaceae bacterium]